MNEPQTGGRSVHEKIVSCVVLLVAPFLSGQAAALLAQSPDGALSLHGDRFRVTAHWRSEAGVEGVGRPVVLGEESGYFWFFTQGNTELVVKLLNGCSLPSERFWFFAAGLTNLEITLEVEDLRAGESSAYFSPLGQPFEPILDTSAFATCDLAVCGSGSRDEILATPRTDRRVEMLARSMAQTFTAPQDVYDRLSEDLAAIEASTPELAEHPFLPRFTPDVLVFLAADSAVFQAIQDGSYSEWRCLNEWYGGAVLRFLEIINGGELGLDGIFDMEQIAEEYSVLPGLRHVEINSISYCLLLPTPGCDDTICGVIDQDTDQYNLYYEKLGELYYYTSRPGELPVLVGVAPANEALWNKDHYQCLASR